MALRTASAGLCEKRAGAPALTAIQPVTGSLRRQWPRAFRDCEAKRLAVLRLITSSIMVACCTCRPAGFCAIAWITLQGSDRQALDLVDREARSGRFCGLVRGLGFCCTAGILGGFGFCDAAAVLGCFRFCGAVAVCDGFGFCGATRVLGSFCFPAMTGVVVGFRFCGAVAVRDGFD